MNKSSVIGMAFLLLAVRVAPALAQDKYPIGIIGSIEIPALHDANKGAQDLKAAAVKLYSQPLDDAAVLATITDRWHIESVEHGYEQVSAGVLDVKWQTNNRWYLVQYKSAGRLHEGWLSQRDAGRFRTLPELLVGGKAFLTDAWDRALYAAPHPDATKQLVTRERKTDSVAVASAARSPRGSSDWKHLWLLVVILDGSFCDGGPQTVVAAGWIPAYSASGELTTWHSSRGC